MSKILITGATGHLGTAVVDELLGKTGPENISVLARDISKAAGLKEKGTKVLHGDYDDYDSLVKAFMGTDKLYFISASDVFKRKVQHENIIKAATEAKVGHIIYTSFQRKTDDESSPIALVASAHVLAEKLILKSGLTYTIMKHALYADVVPSFVGDQVLHSGVIYLPAGNGKGAYTSRSDMASAGAAVLAGKGHENKIYEISVGKSYSFNDIAAILSELSGKKITYKSADPEVFRKDLEKAGVPAEAIQGVVSFCKAISQGEFDFPDNTLEKLIGRKPESLKELLKKAYNL